MQFLQRKKWFCRGVLALSAAALSFGAGLSHGAQKLRLSTLGPGSAPYVVMTTFANIVNEHVPDYRIQVNATGAATRHAVETAQGRSEFCLNTPHQYDMMVKGAVLMRMFRRAGSCRKICGRCSVFRSGSITS